MVPAYSASSFCSHDMSLARDDTYSHGAQQARANAKHNDDRTRPEWQQFSQRAVRGVLWLDTLLDQENSTHLADWLATSPAEVRGLAYGGNLKETRHFTDNDMAALLKALEGNKAVAMLSLSGISISPAGAEALANLLKVNRTLVELNLSGAKIGDQGASCLSAALPFNQTLRSLNLSANRIGKAGANYLSHALRGNHALATLDLSSNNLDCEAARFLSEALKNNKTLVDLRLSCNNIGAQGAERLAEALRINHSLVALDLSENVIGSRPNANARGWEALAENQALATLDLTRNGLRDEDARVLADVLKTNGTLTTLSLAINNIGNDGILALAVALKANATLSKLHLHGNLCSDDRAALLLDALKGNRVLTDLSPPVVDLGNREEGRIQNDVDQASATNHFYRAEFNTELEKNKELAGSLPAASVGFMLASGNYPPHIAEIILGYMVTLPGVGKEDARRTLDSLQRSVMPASSGNSAPGTMPCQMV